MKSITVRGIDPSVADMLKNEAAREGKSVNQFIKDIIDAKLGLGNQKKHSATYHDLDHLFGKWDKEEFEKIQGKINRERVIDEELWS
ncbi:MAG: antitoxin [delta proteobacterium ML8_D]|nr:MAG: antitoxin [delta proteobacterium ML8_D]